MTADPAPSGPANVPLAELLERNLPDLHAYVRLRLGGALRRREDTVDVVQSVCRDLLEHADQFEYRGDIPFRAWLFGIAVRKILDRADYWRAARRDPGKVASLGSSQGAPPEDKIQEVYRGIFSPSQDAMGREMVERVEAAFSGLATDYQEVILLSKVGGLSRAEVAAQMGRSEASVRNLLSRGLAELSERIRERSR